MDVAWAHFRRGGCVMHEVNVSELAFTMPRKIPAQWSPRIVVDWLEKAGIAAVEGFDSRWAEIVAEIRLAAPALNIGDGVAVALAVASEVDGNGVEASFILPKKPANLLKATKPFVRGVHGFHDENRA